MFRNKEFRCFAVLFFVLAIAGLTAGFAISFAAGILALTLSAVFGISFTVFTKQRYRSLARLSMEIDLILHDEDRMELDAFEEGELSILHSEVNKMTLRIREQNEALKKDKQHLTDSLADIAHQLRTPLTSATLALSLLKKTLHEESLSGVNADEIKLEWENKVRRLKKERQKFIYETEKLLAQMDWLLTSLLKLSRLDAGIAEFQSERFYVKDLIKSALRPLLIPMELQSIALYTDIPEDAALQGDLNWLSEAAENIIKNCIENVGKNGEIRIICKDTALYTEIIISDNGKGFAKEDLPHLFDRFYRGKNQNTSGYGIGLALSKIIISRQGGIVTAKNHHSGAMFALRFAK